MILVWFMRPFTYTKSPEVLLMPRNEIVNTLDNQSIYHDAAGKSSNLVTFTVEQDVNIK